MVKVIDPALAAHRAAVERLNLILNLFEGSLGPPAIVLRLPLPATRNRNVANWRASDSHKKAFFAAADRQTLATRFPAAPLGHVLASAKVYPAGKNDQDNLLARLKSVQDWCKNRGIVSDDTPDCWHWIRVPEQTIQRAEPAYLVLTLYVVPTVLPSLPLSPGR